MNSLYVLTFIKKWILTASAYIGTWRYQNIDLMNVHATASLE